MIYLLRNKVLRIMLKWLVDMTIIIITYLNDAYLENIQTIAHPSDCEDCMSFIDEYWEFTEW